MKLINLKNLIRTGICLPLIFFGLSFSQKALSGSSVYILNDDNTLLPKFFSTSGTTLKLLTPSGAYNYTLSRNSSINNYLNWENLPVTISHNINSLSLGLDINVINSNINYPSGQTFYRITSLHKNPQSVYIPIKLIFSKPLPEDTTITINDENGTSAQSILVKNKDYIYFKYSNDGLPAISSLKLVVTIGERELVYDLTDNLGNRLNQWDVINDEIVEIIDTDSFYPAPNVIPNSNPGDIDSLGFIQSTSNFKYKIPQDSFYDYFYNIKPIPNNAEIVLIPAGCPNNPQENFAQNKFILMRNCYTDDPIFSGLNSSQACLKILAEHCGLNPDGSDGHYLSYNLDTNNNIKQYRHNTEPTFNFTNKDPNVTRLVTVLSADKFFKEGSQLYSTPIPELKLKFTINKTNFITNPNLVNFIYDTYSQTYTESQFINLPSATKWSLYLQHTEQKITSLVSQLNSEFNNQISVSTTFPIINEITIESEYNESTLFGAPSFLLENQITDPGVINIVLGINNNFTSDVQAFTNQAFSSPGFYIVDYALVNAELFRHEVSHCLNANHAFCVDTVLPPESCISPTQPSRAYRRSDTVGDYNGTDDMSITGILSAEKEAILYNLTLELNNDMTAAQQAVDDRKASLAIYINPYLENIKLWKDYAYFLMWMREIDQ